MSLGVGASQLSCGFELAPSFIPHPSLYALVLVCAFNEEFSPERERERERERLVKRLDLLLQRVDAVPVTRKQKLLLYKAGICPRLSWDLSIISPVLG